MTSQCIMASKTDTLEMNNVKKIHLYLCIVKCAITLVKQENCVLNYYSAKKDIIIHSIVYSIHMYGNKLCVYG